MRVVLDANVIVSAIISGRGAPSQILDEWEAGRFEVALSPAILDEIARVLGYPRIRERYKVTDRQAQQILSLLRSQAVIVEPEVSLDVVRADPTDNRYMECALAARADALVSGDHHLLDLGHCQAIQILAPAAFLAYLRLKG